MKTFVLLLNALSIEAVRELLQLIKERFGDELTVASTFSENATVEMPVNFDQPLSDDFVVAAAGHTGLSITKFVTKYLAAFHKIETYQDFITKHSSMETFVTQFLEDTSRHKITITRTGSTKLQLVKRIKELTGYGLKEAKESVDNLPSVIGIHDYETAVEWKRELEDAGATVELRPVGYNPAPTPEIADLEPATEEDFITDEQEAYEEDMAAEQYDDEQYDDEDDEEMDYGDTITASTIIDSQFISWAASKFDVGASILREYLDRLELTEGSATLGDILDHEDFDALPGDVQAAVNDLA